MKKLAGDGRLEAKGTWPLWSLLSAMWVKPRKQTVFRMGRETNAEVLKSITDNANI